MRILDRLVVRIGQLDKGIRGDRWRPWVRLFYQVLSTLYDPATRFLVPDYQLSAIELLERLNVAGRDRVLDLGCGTGMVTLPAAKKARWTVGLDMTSGMLHKLQGKARQQSVGCLSLIQADTRFLPLAEEAFTMVATSFMLVHLTREEKQQVFDEAWRVLESSGRFGCLTGPDAVGDVYPIAEE